MIALLGLLTIFSLISTTFVNSFDQVYYTGDNAFIHALIIMAFLFIIWFIHDKLHFRVTDRVLLVSLILMTVLTGVYIAAADLPPRFD